MYQNETKDYKVMHASVKIKKSKKKKRQEYIKKKYENRQKYINIKNIGRIRRFTQTMNSMNYIYKYEYLKRAYSKPMLILIECTFWQSSERPENSLICLEYVGLAAKRLK